MAASVDVYPSVAHFLYCGSRGASRDKILVVLVRAFSKNFVHCGSLDTQGLFSDCGIEINQPTYIAAMDLNGL